MSNNQKSFVACTADMRGVPSGMNREEAAAFFGKGELPSWAKSPEQTSAQPAMTKNFYSESMAGVASFEPAKP